MCSAVSVELVVSYLPSGSRYISTSIVLMESLHDRKSVQDMGSSGSDKDINCVFGDILMAEDW